MCPVTSSHPCPAPTGFSQYLGLSMSMDALAAAVSAATCLLIAPHFNNPYASTSRACPGAGLRWAVISQLPMHVG